MKSIHTIKRTFVRQHSEDDCGLACLAMIFNYAGKSSDISALWFTAVGPGGTSLLDLCNLATMHNLQSRCVEMEMSFLRNITTPCILHTVTTHGEQHFQVCYGSKRFGSVIKYLMADPSKQVYHLEESELEDDPRWMSADAARFAGSWVKKEEKGTLIEFPKTTDLLAIRTADGKPIKNEQGVTQTKTVEFEKPQQGKAFLFNAEQMKDITPLKEFLAKQDESQKLSPVKRAEKLIEDSKAVIVHGGQEAYYDKQLDKIFLPEMEAFENETRYYQAAIHELAHWTGHESRLNRPMEGKFGSLEYSREEMRAAVAAILIGGELKIGHNFGQQATYMKNFAKILKDTPFEIAKVSGDAQKIADLLIGVSQKLGQKQVTEAGFKKGDEIVYMDTTYKVIETYKNKNIKVEDADGARKVLKPEYGLFKSLLEAKTNPMEPEMVMEQEQVFTQGQEQIHKIGR